MLGFGMILGLFGLGAAMVLTDQDDGTQTLDDENMPDQNETGDEAEIVSVASFLPQAESESPEIAETVPDETTETEDVSQNVPPMDVSEVPTDQAQTSQSMAEPSDGEDWTDGQEPQDESMSDDVQIISGGPGDTISGQLGEDRFEITLGDRSEEPTVIECFDCDGSNDPASLSADEMLDTIWFRDEAGDLLTQDELLEKEFFVEENDEIDGISLVFSDHQTIHLPGMALDEFVENSMVIGNYGVEAA